MTNQEHWDSIQDLYKKEKKNLDERRELLELQYSGLQEVYGYKDKDLEVETNNYYADTLSKLGKIYTIAHLKFLNLNQPQQD